MFYGTIKSDGTIDTTTGFSNNFKATGNYIVTFLEYMRNAPSMVLAPIANNTGDVVSIEYIMSTYTYDPGTNTAQPFVATVRIVKQGDGLQTNKPMSFEARSGQRLTFSAAAQDKSTLTLKPKVINFQGSKVLTLSTSFSKIQIGGVTKSGYTAYLDGGTVLIGVGTGLTLTLDSNTVSDTNGNTWALTGWTFGGESGAHGTEWANSGQSFVLMTDPSLTGPATTPYSFTIKGVRTTGSGQQYISSDPIVRLSSVAPGGIVTG